MSRRAAPGGQARPRFPGGGPACPRL